MFSVFIAALLLNPDNISLCHCIIKYNYKFFIKIRLYIFSVIFLFIRTIYLSVCFYLQILIADFPCFLSGIPIPGSLHLILNLDKIFSISFIPVLVPQLSLLQHPKQIIRIKAHFPVFFQIQIHSKMQMHRKISGRAFHLAVTRIAHVSY